MRSEKQKLANYTELVHAGENVTIEKGVISASGGSGDEGGGSGGETWYKYYVYFEYEPSELFPDIKAGENGDLTATGIYLNDEISCVWDMNDERVIIPSTYRIGTLGFCFQGISFDYREGPDILVYNMTNTDSSVVQAQALIYTNIPFELDDSNE